MTSQIRTATPSRAQIAPISICNLRCETCTLWFKDIEGSSPNSGLDNRLSDDVVKGLIDQLAEWGIQRLEMADGEPFLRKSTPDLIEYASSKGLETLVISNGTLITDALAERLVNVGLGTFILSLDGPEDVHDRVRGVKGTYKKLANAALRLAHHKERLGKDRPAVFFHCIVSKGNYERLSEVVESAAQLKTPMVAFHYLSRIPQDAVEETNRILGEKYSSDAHHYTVEEDLRIPEEELPRLRESLERVLEMSRRCQVNVRLDPLLSDLAHVGRSVPRTFVGEGCPLVEDYVQISPAGNLHPCPLLTGRGLGSVREKKIADIFNDPASVEIRAKIQREFPLPICKHCCYRER